MPSAFMAAVRIMLADLAILLEATQASITEL